MAANAITGYVHPLLVRGEDISSMVPYWDKVDTIVEGYEAIKSCGVKYLPKFVEETEADYKIRLEMSKFTNIYRDVLEGLATKPFEEEISLLGGDKIPTEANDFVEDVDGAGNNLTMFSALTFFCGINDAINWIFVDYPTIDPDVKLSVAQAKEKNLKPFWSHVLARNVLEVRTMIIGGKELLSYIRIFEPKNDTTSQDQVRVFERSDAGVVTWELWKKNPEKIGTIDEFYKVKEGQLSIDLIPLVPFITGRRDGRTFKFSPVMRDAADLQIDLYQDESALKFIKTMAGYPMLAANGMKPQMEADGKTPKKLAIGPMRVLYGVPDGAGNNGEFKFIEPTANSLEFLQKSIDKTKQDLRELGRQPLTALSTQLTTVTTSIAAGKARSAVTAWALALKDALENAMKITMQYMKVTYDAEVFVFTGFDNVTDDSADLDALDKARARNDLSQETFLAELKRRKVLSPEFDYEAEKKKLLNDIPVDSTSSDNPPAPAAPPKKPVKKNP
jgi:hypothetical protein